MTPRRTAVAILGAGPAGLILAHLLDEAGVDNVVLEKHTREHVESRLRAGVLEHGTVTLLRRLGLADRLDREGKVLPGVELRFDGECRRIPLADLTGRPMTVYGQRELVRDLIAARLERGGDIVFEAGDAEPVEVRTREPRVVYQAGASRRELACTVVAGCDGSHGSSARAVERGELTVHERQHPFAWLGLLAHVPPSYAEVVYASSPAGFALGSSRSPQVSRLYLQCSPGEQLEDWPDERAWAELHRRLAAPGFRLEEGPVLEKDLTRMRSRVVEPVRSGRLFLAGDAAHVVPPTGAKGLNLAAADAADLADALVGWFVRGDRHGLDTYSQRCLRRTWRVQQFTWEFTTMLHVADASADPAEDLFERRLQRARFDRVTADPLGMRAFAEEYAGCR